jgi:hypothetical protein
MPLSGSVHPIAHTQSEEHPFKNDSNAVKCGVGNKTCVFGFRCDNDVMKLTNFDVFALVVGVIVPLVFVAAVALHLYIS